MKSTKGIRGSRQNKKGKMQHKQCDTRWLEREEKRRMRNGKRREDKRNELTLEADMVE